MPPPGARRAGRGVIAAAAAALSLIVHALLGAAPAIDAPEPDRPVEAARKLPPVAGVFEQAARHARVAEGRRRLVDEARAKLARGELELGEFLLAANELDAQEQRRPLDIAKARARYQAHLRDLRDAMSHEDVRGAVAAVFGHLRYHGRAGGRMADALVEGGGSCEPISQLVAASLYDAGLGESAYLRFYGGAIDGATHLAPIYVVHGQGTKAAGGGRARAPEREFDLMSGGVAERGGVRFPASELVEAYARAHGLAPVIAASSARGAGPPAGSGAAPAAAAPSTMAGGYPPNADRYPGNLPLFSARAVNEVRPDRAAKAVEPVDQVPNCAFMVRMAVLDPPRLLIEPPAAPRGAHSGAEAFLAVEPRRVPHPQSVERQAILIKAVEQKLEDARTDHADRLMALSCLVALYDGAAVDLALLSEPDLAATAARKRGEAAAAGAKALAAVQWKEDEGAKVRRRLSGDYGGRSWILLLLPGGEEVVFDLVGSAQREDWGVINALAALVVAPRTRSRVVTLLGAMPRRDQADVMHEVLHAHDHLRPWASHYELEGGDGEFYRAYRVFRAIGWALWEGGRSAEETLAALQQGVAAERLHREWEVLFIEYYARNALGLNQSRPGGLAVARTLKDWLARRSYPELEVFRRRLDYLDSQEKLDSTTLSDAWRIQ